MSSLLNDLYELWLESKSKADEHCTKTYHKCFRIKRCNGNANAPRAMPLVIRVANYTQKFSKYFEQEIENGSSTATTSTQCWKKSTLIEQANKSFLSSFVCVFKHCAKASKKEKHCTIQSNENAENEATK